MFWSEGSAYRALMGCPCCFWTVCSTNIGRAKGFSVLKLFSAVTDMLLHRVKELTLSLLVICFRLDLTPVKHV